MKSLYIYLIHIPIFMFSQSSIIFSSERANLSRFEIYPVNHREILSELKNDSDFSLFDESRFNELIPYFYFIDIDGDEDSEIIFNGFTGGAESESIYIYKKYDKKYKTIFESYGVITKLEKPKIGLFNFQFFQSACCAGYIHHVYEYSASIPLGKIKFSLINYYALPDRMEIPKKLFKKNIPFEINNDQYKLRLYPAIDDTSIGLFPEDNIGNTLSIYPKGSLGYAISKTLDNTGRVWWFVVMHNNIDPIETIIYEGHITDKSMRSTGWMSSRYLKQK